MSTSVSVGRCKQDGCGLATGTAYCEQHDPELRDLVPRATRWLGDAEARLAYRRFVPAAPANLDERLLQQEARAAAKEAAPKTRPQHSWGWGTPEWKKKRKPG